MKSLARFAAVSLVLLPSYLCAQSGAAKAAPPETARPQPVIVLTPADIAWLSLKAASRDASVTKGAANATALAQAQEKAKTDALQEADNYKDFYTKNPKHIRVREARAQEALALLRAWSAGDTSQDKRREQLIFGVRRDTAIPLALRARVAAWSDHLTVAKQPSLSQNDRFLAYEKAIRGLMREFPTLPDGYEALGRLARDASDERAVSIARELVRKPVPAAVKADAQRLLNRYALIGRPLADVVKPVLGSTNAFTGPAGHGTIIYTWSTWSRPSIELAKRIVAGAPPGTKTIGINLDADTPVAKGMAANEKLSGDQFYLAGPDDELARQLELSTPALVYVADSKGRIRSVSGQHNLNAAIATLGTK